jgi:hypothetical protein
VRWLALGALLLLTVILVMFIVAFISTILGIEPGICP